jgi:predicted short-subunit dehydrogenase-like oxidoreductase (DUF2520 family)
MKIVLLGSGNVATHLGAALKAAGNEILQVWSRYPANAKVLAGKLDSEFTSDFSSLNPSADLYILAVSDDAIPTLAAEFKFPGKLLVHTSGTTGIDFLRNAPSETGVLYPLQTFSKNKPVDFSAVPIVVEGSTPEVTKMLTSLASEISRKVIQLELQQRRALHVAAVFACNFSNHLYTIAQEILKDNRLDFNLIRPLIA